MIKSTGLEIGIEPVAQPVTQPIQIIAASKKEVTCSIERNLSKMQLLGKWAAS